MLTIEERLAAAEARIAQLELRLGWQQPWFVPMHPVTPPQQPWIVPVGPTVTPWQPPPTPRC